jgi:hypothetical protein
MKINQIITKVSRVYYTDCGDYLRVIEQHGDPAWYYIKDFEGNWIEVCQDTINEIQEAEEDYDLKLKGV